MEGDLWQLIRLLPEKLSTDLTSLNYHEDRPAIIIEILIGDGGALQGSNIYRARVCNQAKLAYNSVAAWLEGKKPMPEAVASVPGLAENLRLQDRVAQQLKALRHEHGALDLQTLQARPVFVGYDPGQIEFRFISSQGLRPNWNSRNSATFGKGLF
jgi:exoribonuclease R